MQGHNSWTAILFYHELGQELQQTFSNKIIKSFSKNLLPRVSSQNII